MTTTPARSRSPSSGRKVGTSPGAVDLALGEHGAGGVVHRGDEAERDTDRLGSVGGPFGDRGHRAGAAQDRSGGHGQPRR